MIDKDIAPQLAQMGAVELLQKPQQLTAKPATCKQCLTVARKAEAFEMMVRFDMCQVIYNGHIEILVEGGTELKVDHPNIQHADIETQMLAVYYALCECRDKLTEDEDDDEPGECSRCAGTGEGYVDGSRCTCCGGSGIKRQAKDDDDFPEPDDRMTY